MSGISIIADTLPVKNLLDQLVDKLENMTPVMATIGEIVVSQVDEAFEAGVSPSGVTWEPSRRVLEAGGQTLVDTARLRNSITRLITTDSVMIGTNVIYAAIHQLGGVIRPKTARALVFGGLVRRSVTMPSRPFLPDESSVDWAEISDALERYLI